jgi:hypothetical protein
MPTTILSITDPTQFVTASTLLVSGYIFFGSEWAGPNTMTFATAEIAASAVIVLSDQSVDSTYV